MVIKQRNFILFLSFFSLLVIFDQTLLPDYDSYKRIYISINQPVFGVDLFFYNLMYLSNYFNFQYDLYRYLFLFLSITLLYFTFQKFKFEDKPKKYFFSLSLLFIAVSGFILEFYLIRIRAGLAILFFLIATYFFLKEKNLRASIFFGLSFLSHLYSALILSCIIAVPIVLKNSKFKAISHLPFIFVFLGLIFLSSILRGTGLESELNIFRFLFLIFPLFLIYFSLHKIKENKNIIYRVTHISYLYFSFSLTILYVLGLTDTAGEAIVRLSGLYSAPFLLLALNSNIKDGYISYYYTSGNSLFFLYTLGLFA